MQKILMFGSALLLMSFQARAWDSPWQSQSAARTPWGSDDGGSETSSDRKAARENFFERLNPDSGQAETNPSPSSPDQYSEPAEERFPTNPTSGDRSLNDDFEYKNAVVQTAEKTPVELAATNEAPSESLRLPWDEYRTQYPHSRFIPRQLLWPVYRGRLTSGYGLRGSHFHEGVDISSPEGTPIHAAYSGRVVFTGFLAGYGNLIVVYHGQGYSSVYAHTEKNIRHRGEYVRRGEAIALIGKTGHATGYHVHFEIRRDGKPVNPLQFTFIGSPLLAERPSRVVHRVSRVHRYAAHRG